jgi:hypothetical protein
MGLCALTHRIFPDMGRRYAWVSNPPPDEHLMQIGPATAFPFRAYFCEIIYGDYQVVESPGLPGIVHVFDDLVTLASGRFETFPVENDNFAAVVTDQFA